MSERGQNREVQGHRGWEKMLLIVFNQLNANSIRSDTKPGKLDLISEQKDHGDIFVFRDEMCIIR